MDAHTPGTLCNEGIVTAVFPSYITVKITLQSACSGCHAKGVCLSSQRKNEVIRIPVEKSDPFYVGESIEVYMKESSGVKAIVIGYVFPFLLLIISLFLAYRIMGNELYAFLISLVSISAYYLLIGTLNKKKKIDKHFILKARKKS